MKEGWEYKKLGEVADFYRGLTYGQSDEAESSNVCVLRSNNIDLQSMSLNLDEIKYLKPGFVIPEDKKLKGESIFICMSNGSKQHVGKVAYIPNDMDYAFGGFMGLIVPKGVSAKYIYYVCCSSLYREFLSSIGNGIGITNLRFSDLNNFTFPISDLKQQKKIVSELDLLSGVIEKQKAQLEELDKLAQSIFYDMFGSYDDNTSVSSYITNLAGGKSLAGEMECENKVLKTGAVTFDYFNQNEVKNLPIDYSPLPEHLVNDGDVLISRMNTPELVGACAYVWEAPSKTYLPDRLWRASLNEKINPIFLWISLIQPKAKEQIRALASGTSGSMKNISKPNFLRVKIKGVPLSLQQEFAAKVEAIEAMKAKVRQSLKEAETLFNERMNYYFN